MLSEQAQTDRERVEGQTLQGLGKGLIVMVDMSQSAVKLRAPEATIYNQLWTKIND